MIKILMKIIKKLENLGVEKAEDLGFE